ncbi:MAG: RNA 2',3'-cyclic phosphodiesterase [bacterium]|nr:RNA 2',3'-cyclic phosphodiesterase [bacterium]
MAPVTSVFIALNLKDSVKRELLLVKERFPELPARWVSLDNLHITLAFLGNRSQKEIAHTANVLQKIGEEQKPIDISFSEISYGPPQGPPCMVWALLEPNALLNSLQKEIVQDLAKANLYKQEKSTFSPHVTLARLKELQFQNIEQEEQPNVSEPLSLACKISSMEIMESRQGRGVMKYTEIESIPFLKT